MMVGRELTKLAREFPGQFTVDRVDILTNPGRALKDGIKMIPTLQSGDRRLSGIFLSSAEIRDFVTAVLAAATG